jgi:hypothetical protein
MQELIDKLKAEAGVTDEQAVKVIAALKAYIIEKYPMLEGMVGSFIGGGSND